MNRGHIWRVELFGGLQAVGEERVVSRFRTQKTAAALAYLAYYLGKPQPRDYLAELLWPEDEPEAARASLRTALSSLRRQLEPPGVPAGSMSKRCVSSAAIGRCSTPFGTTNNSPGPRTTSPALS